MSIRIGINGFGRIGRLVTRAGWHVPDIDLVHVNEPNGGIACAAHLLEFDSIHGHFNQQVSHRNNKIKINVALAKSSPIGVDTEEDYLAIKKIMEYKP